MSFSPRRWEKWLKEKPTSQGKTRVAQGMRTPVLTRADAAVSSLVMAPLLLKHVAPIEAMPN